MKKELLIRTYVVLAFLLLITAVLIGRVVQVGWLQKAKWQEISASLEIKPKEIIPERGDIIADDGSMLASSIVYFEVRMDLKSDGLTDTIFYSHVDSLALCLTRDFLPNFTAKEYKQKLVNERRKGNRYFLIKRKVNYEQLKRMRTYPIFRRSKYKSGMIVEEHYTRIKPFKNLASVTIGKYRSNARMLGVEASYDEHLKGKSGHIFMQKNRDQFEPLNDLLGTKAESGNDVVTTINIDIQDAADRALSKALKEHNADFGCAIVMDVKTGDIKAMSNLNLTKDGKALDNQNYAIENKLEPGSTFKLATMMAMLNDGKFSIYDSIDLNRGKMKVHNLWVRDSEHHGIYRTSIKHAFEISSNVAMAQLVKQYYPGNEEKYFLNELRRLEIDRKSGIDLEGEIAPNVRSYKRGLWSATTAEWMAHGYEIELAPIQLIGLYNTIANDGIKVQPRLVTQIRKGSSVIEEFPVKKVGRIAKASTVKACKEMLEGVVKYGTGDDLHTDAYNFAGKTGTTRIAQRADDIKKKYKASFVGYFPAENPKYTCLVMVYNPKEKYYYGSKVAGPVFREIADFIFSTDRDLIKVLNDDDQIEVAHNDLPLYDVGYAEDMKTSMAHLGLKGNQDLTSPWAIMVQDSTSVKLDNRNVKKDRVPNVVGMGIRDALYLLENFGLDVKLNGFGKVVEQSIKPGVAITGQHILLTLK